MAIKENKKRIMISISKDNLKILDDICKTIGVTRSSYIQSALVMFWKVLSNTKIED